MYQPKPINTTAVRLPPDIIALTERLAEHIHDVWSQRKIREGWQLGPTDPETKKHASLISYQELSESEKDYDRATAMEAIRALYALGYKVSR